MIRMWGKRFRPRIRPFLVAVLAIVTARAPTDAALRTSTTRDENHGHVGRRPRLPQRLLGIEPDTAIAHALLALA
jgi:hypothetical protein